jgi:hypothetical protein
MRMGSLRLRLEGHNETEQRFGRTAAELKFKDEDGTDVLVALNLDEDGIPFELDVWRTDFGQLRRIPDDL